ncbi:hydantoinase/oxoprolinase family protein [Natranaeroarchaeum aerophilus]|uniref:Hydantoinase/oxoprolinase family protein n=1 Tax=Natranaeroarchaeum aerophilus TaxID=2917711 RepID=A0AAE3FRG6_9EURY|nr:hydantoinase/oxoprolinase family protein [Natranaeroarchaeum aerophilus]
MPRVGVDVGGTFTDVVLVTEDRVCTAKVPSTEPQHEGVLTGIKKASNRAGITPREIESFVHATTVPVNALLERAGAETALVTTAGFRDVLEIGRQTRPDLYDLAAEKTPPLVPRHRRYELDERSTVDGVEEPIDLGPVDELAEALSDIDSVAVSFLHAYRHPTNEAKVAATLRDRLDVPVSASSEVLPTFREYERTSTTVVDAYLRPAIDSYLGELVAGATEIGLPEPQVMQSNGGIADPDRVRERAVTTVLSGPAAGVVGASASADGVLDTAGVEGIVTFDMGGTSSDVGVVRERGIARTTDATVAGQPIGTPIVDIETVGSGGGSIAWVDEGGALRVGPESAGADPGPVCYGNGGDRPTVTDANVVLGYIGAGTEFGGEVTLDEAAAREALADLAEEAGLSSAVEAAEGIYRVANATMTRAIRSVTIERGHDPRTFGLVAFGGAGPMHAAALAEQLDIDRVVFPLAGGVLSAYGLLAADEKHDAVRTRRVELSDADPETLARIYEELIAEVESNATADAAPEIERTAALRYRGQSFELDVDVDERFDPATVRERFVAAHEQAYGYAMDDPVELVTLRVTGTVENEPPRTRYRPQTAESAEPNEQPTTRSVVFDGEERTATVSGRTAFEPGTTIDGPAILEGEESTTVIPPRWTGDVRRDGAIVCKRGDQP